MSSLLTESPPSSQRPGILQVIGEPCRHCNATDGFTRHEQGPHIGEYCIACERWQRWIPRRESLKLVKPALPDNTGHVWGPAPAEEQPPKYSPRQLAHPQNIDERLAAVEHDIGVLAQLIVGPRRELTEDRRQ